MNTVITIGRQYGSLGHEIGERVAELFDIKYYDKAILTEAAKHSGICEEMLKIHDETATNSFLYNLVMDNYSFGISTLPNMDMPISQKVFMAQYNTIQKLAQESPCVIVGRCADYVLQDNKNTVRIFIYCDFEERVKRVMEQNNLSDSKARELIRSKDKQRSSYYNYYSSKKWGKAESYDLCIDSSLLGIEGTAIFIKDFVERVEQNRN